MFNTFTVAGQQPQQTQLTRKQLRWFKRGAKTQAYYAGHHVDPVNLTGADHVRANAARAKRARRAEKRAALAGAAS